MPRSTKRVQLAQRRQQVAHLYVQGFTQTQIAHQLAVSQATISGDLKVVEQQWRSAAVRDFDLGRQHELQKLALIEQEAWLAWQRSQQPQHSADRSESARQRTTTTTRIRNQYGDPRFLALVHHCIASRRALLGLDLPAVAPETDPHEQADLEQRRRRVLALVANLAQPQPTSGA